MSKLLLHKIPLYVPSEELLKVIPGDFTIELKVEHTLLASYIFYGLPTFSMIKLNYVHVHMKNWK